MPLVRKRAKLIVYVDLDPVPGVFHTADSAQSTVQNLLNRAIEHYNPVVLVDRFVTGKENDNVTLP